MAILSLVTAPAATPITLAEAKAHLRVTSSSEDTYITGLIDAAVSHIDGRGELGRAMITQTWAQSVCQSPGEVRLVMGPNAALVSVQYYDAAGTLQTATLGDFELVHISDFTVCRPRDGYSWPTADTRPDAIRITYTAGFGATEASVPAGLRHALKMLVAHWYENRTPTTDGNARPVPYAVDALIGNERVSWYG